MTSSRVPPVDPPSAVAATDLSNAPASAQKTVLAHEYPETTAPACPPNTTRWENTTDPPPTAFPHDPLAATDLPASASPASPAAHRANSPHPQNETLSLPLKYDCARSNAYHQSSM